MLNKSNSNEEEVAAIFGAFMSSITHDKVKEQQTDSGGKSKWRLNRV
jgi:hypothetical protein